ncbi:methyltransferase domain-containing protein [Candidatus Pacearchaeota archaeon]|nr:methyltransferase domain-containing protein [Candidatus Pacearchaeota archaeon]
MQQAKPIIIDSIKRLNPTSALDLGCGKCNFSKIFIDKGIRVTGIDKSPVAKSKNNFSFIQKDIQDFKFEEKYDLIIGTGILHFLKRKDAHKLIKKMKENTISKGSHFLICMSSDEKPNDKSHFYPNKEELSKLYANWNIIHNISCLSKKHGKISHQHKMIVFLAEKI